MTYSSASSTGLSLSEEQDVQNYTRTRCTELQ